MTDIAARYRRLAARFTEIAEAVPDDRWDAASPCEGWTVADVVAHVADSQVDFLSRHDLLDGAVDPDAHPLARWVAVRDRFQAALDDPEVADRTYDGYFGPTTIGETAETFYTGDLLVHGWDVARGAGLGHLESLPADEVDRVLASMQDLPEEALRSEQVYGPAIEVPEDADPQTRFLAFTGRRP
ncbi:TIGR03086 family metal-binding protein [Euzebya sp.]|uniref:TIGR03086 family metal-binding protein n=1 Tax=Euzebya sp. TaxID=1971409 RepID=UPI003513F2AB